MEDGAASEMSIAASPKREPATATSESAPDRLMTIPTTAVVARDNVTLEVSTAASPKAESAATTIKSMPPSGALEISPVASAGDSGAV